LWKGYELRLQEFYLGILQPEWAHSECILPQNQDPRVAEKFWANLVFGICQNTLTNPYPNSLWIQDLDQESCGNLGSWILVFAKNAFWMLSFRMQNAPSRRKSKSTFCLLPAVCIHIRLYLGTRRRENQYRKLSKIANLKPFQKIDTQHRKHQ